ncbi:Asp-tRNA(Asn)/Glu-tRNA(Gln) amidotransferase subunit GatC [Thalassoglobus polymorphus]|uniref:Aspartyl/glutamyl-tRNA(Asn/Gln) amidotransferase subunit C n=1 Tax=Thalassoglobus polymorphus TaxID=2527994 RepID=A0A517QS48_9PLAN|nr:Asp-tRNA(Asn)/Glu-tRNA(Gln) amidotransferase subunit GatC [Thalassoglobus polymorphus]QDT34458.1 Glutamyl-tRNA(Gln) amidotransferase subunit C [Thalassoglobus polymorphus]
MTLSTEDVQKVAKLARLKLTPDEVEQFAGQLGHILGYVEMLNEVDTDNVQPMAHAADVTNVFRSDEVQASLPRETALENAPKTDGKYFLVPQILEGS